MKRVFVIILTLALVLTLSGCKGPAVAPAAPGADDAVPAAPVKPEDTAWRYDLTTETSLEKYRADNGTLLAVWRYEQPVLQLRNAGGEPFSGDMPGRGVTEAQLTVCKAFNTAASESAQNARASFEDLKAGALEQYTEMGEEYRAFFDEHTEETWVAEVYWGGDLLDITLSFTGYWGGAHGGASVRSLHFDLAAGEFVTLNDLSDDPAALRAAIAENIIAQIRGGEATDEYFEGWEDTIRAKDDFNADFSGDAMTVTFEQYEIAPYVVGMPEFTIPYELLAPHLNARGARLLGLSQEAAG